MSDLVERKIGELTIRIDRATCIGSGNCAKVAPGVFELDAEAVAAFTEKRDVAEPEQLLEACRVCPVDALLAISSDGKQLVP